MTSPGAGEHLVLSSERVSLRPLDRADVSELHRIWTDEHVRRFLWDGEILPIAQTQKIVEESERLFAERSFGLWGVRERASDQLAGFAGFWHFRTPPSLELVFGVAAGHWNRGIATESGRLTIAFAFDVLGFDAVQASTDVMNIGSIRVLERLGMSRVRRAVVDGLDTVFYERTALRS
jgi:ribosomal-protein-alanine N-acetyltransferase